MVSASLISYSLVQTGSEKCSRRYKMEEYPIRDNAPENETLQYASIAFNDSGLFWDDWNFLNGSDRDDSDNNVSEAMSATATSSTQLTVRIISEQRNPAAVNNYWALLALVLVFGTAAGNILVCLAIAWERRLQNVTNYFLMSLAITDLMVAVLVMPLGILTLVYGYFPLQSEHCLVWICLDVLFCTASIMHLCTISVDRYLSLRYPMKFGRNKTRRRVTLKIIFVWLLSIAMSLPLSLMYSKDHASVLVHGTCQIPDPVYKLVGSIVCFYIPLGVMLLTYYLTVRLLAQQRQNLGGTNHHPSGWASGWLGQAPAVERRCTWRRLLKTGHPSTPNHAHSATSTDTELSTLDTHELWLPDSSIPEPTPSTMTALHQFGAEMLKLSRGLESVGLPEESSSQKHGDGSNTNRQETSQFTQKQRLELGQISMRSIGRTSSPTSPLSLLEHIRSSRHKRSRSTWTMTTYEFQPAVSPSSYRKRHSSLPNNIAALHKDCSRRDRVSFQIGEGSPKSRKLSCGESEGGESFCYGPRQSMSLSKNDYLDLPPPCTCPYFGDRPFKATPKPTEVKIISSTHFPRNPVENKEFTTTTTIASTVSTAANGKKPSVDGSIFLPLPKAPGRKLSYSKTASVVTWDSCRYKRRGSSFGGVRTSLLLTPTKVPVQGSPLRRSATLRNHNNANLLNCEANSQAMKMTPSSPCLLQRNTTVRSHHSRNSSVISRNSSRHGRIIRLEQKATKVLGVVFFTFVILWAPFFVLNLLPTVCASCEERISHWVFDFVTWLGYASSMVNPIFYTIFNKVFRQAFKKVLMCKYGGKSNWRPSR